MKDKTRYFIPKDKHQFVKYWFYRDGNIYYVDNLGMVRLFSRDDQNWLDGKLFLKEVNKYELALII